MTFRRYILASIAAMLMAVSTSAHAQQTLTAFRSGYAPMNGLRMYYEIHGTGQPLILVHGGFGSSEMFAPIMPELSKGRQVIAVDLQAHGRTADIERPLSFEAMADDIAALIHSLGFQRADVMGYSVGGEVALRAAIQHPDVVRKLIIVSATFRRDGWYPEIIAGMEHLDESVAEQMKQTPMYQRYQRIAPRPQDWAVLCKKLGLMFRNNYDWTSEASRIKVPVLLLFGHADAVRTAHAVEFFELLGGGKKDGGWDRSGMSPARLAILPGVTHYTIFSSPLLVSTTTLFLDTPVSQVK